MKERPILMCGEMVLATLEDRKTQTRRIVKHPEYMGCLTGDCPHEKQLECTKAITVWAATESPYGVECDRLWVKETFQYTDESLNVQPGWVYRATDPDWDNLEGWKWKPSIFMPRKASRLTLEITSVRVERLQEITEEDAIAEGVTRFACGVCHPHCQENCRRCGYKTLWESINGRWSWDLNPWVFVVEFKSL